MITKIACLNYSQIFAVTARKYYIVGVACKNWFKKIAKNAVEKMIIEKWECKKKLQEVIEKTNCKKSGFDREVQ